MVTEYARPTNNRRPLLSPVLLHIVCGVMLFASIGCSGGGDTIFGDLIESFMPPTPLDAARKMYDLYDADVRRRHIALISASPFGGEEPYVRSYRMLIDDQDPTVRAACLHALGLHGVADDALLIIPLLNDKTGFTRWQAALALQRIHNPAAIEPLIAAMGNDEDADVRMAGATALGQYPQSSVFDSLVGALSDRDYGVVDAACQALQTLTGQTLGTDATTWLEWSHDNRDKLFAQQVAYVFSPYLKPPNIFDKMQFWKKPEPLVPQEPVGMRSPIPEAEPQA